MGRRVRESGQLSTEVDTQCRTAAEKPAVLAGHPGHSRRPLCCPAEPLSAAAGSALRRLRWTSGSLELETAAGPAAAAAAAVAAGPAAAAAAAAVGLVVVWLPGRGGTGNWRQATRTDGMQMLYREREGGENRITHCTLHTQYTIIFML